MQSDLLNKAEMNRHTKCILCNHVDLKQLPIYYSAKGLVKCTNCGLVFMEKIPTDEELNSYYKTYAYENNSDISPITIDSYNTLLDQFEKYRSNNRILDVGCGKGDFLNEAKKRGWEVYGTEYSQKALEICRGNGLNMKQGKLSPDFFPSDYFDVITSIEVLEHINNPNEEIEQIRHFLRKGGLFYCTTPNFDSLMRYYLKTDYNVIVYPEHLAYYTKSTLNQLANKNGFQNTEFLSTGISISRIRASKSTSIEKSVAGTSINSDERLRTRISKSWYLGMLKSIANKLFT